jgi:hypothetical protein
MTQGEELTQLRGALRDVALEELGWNEAMASPLADVAIRRWRSFDRRTKPNKRSDELRVQDLAKGLRQGSPIDLLYVEPGQYERLARRFGALLARCV